MTRFIDAATARHLMECTPELALSLIASMGKKLRMAGKQIYLSFRTVAGAPEFALSDAGSLLWYTAFGMMVNHMWGPTLKRGWKPYECSPEEASY
ncbi:MAG TPA: hypothetical protein DHW14_08805 [Clostridiales bacterium]|nr:hypothetical protein [Clostridiales bacterium]